MVTVLANAGRWDDEVTSVSARRFGGGLLGDLAIRLHREQRFSQFQARARRRKRE
jgi:hypothetical protein